MAVAPRQAEDTTVPYAEFVLGCIPHTEYGVGMPSLIFQFSGSDPQIVSLDRESLTIGRSEDNDLILEHESISSHHAEIIRKDGRLVIRDLGSVNGTKVNGALIQEVFLKHGDVVLFGPSAAQFAADVPINAASAKPGARIMQQDHTGSQTSLVPLHMGLARFVGRRWGQVMRLAKRRPKRLALSALGACLLVWVLGTVGRKHPDSHVNSGAKGSEQKKNVEASREATTNIRFSDPVKTFEIRVYRVLVGDSVVNRKVFYENQLKAERERGNEIVYFDVSVKNDTNDPRWINDTRFTLTDTAGFTYSVKQTLDYLSAEVQPGAIVRGGIAFAIPKDSIPASLAFDTKLEMRSDGKRIYALGSLSSVELFSAHFEANDREPQDFKRNHSQSIAPSRAVSGKWDHRLNQGMRMFGPIACDPDRDLRVLRPLPPTSSEVLGMTFDQFKQMQGHLRWEQEPTFDNCFPASESHIGIKDDEIVCYVSATRQRLHFVRMVLPPSGARGSKEAFSNGQTWEPMQGLLKIQGLAWIRQDRGAVAQEMIGQESGTVIVFTKEYAQWLEGRMQQR